MGRNKKIDELNVYLNTKLVGTLLRKTTGEVRFKYDSLWMEDGFKISNSLPFRQSWITGDEVSYFIDNLLPDNINIKKRISDKFKIPSTKPFDLINTLGRDCIGALMFLPVDEALKPNMKNLVRPISTEEIAKRLRNLASDIPLGMDEGEFRISIAGAQEKMALLKIESDYYEPRGSTATSHIFKTPIGKIFGNFDFSKSVENEHLCLRLCEFFGLKVCKSSVVTFKDQKAIEIERFDRFFHKKVIYRIPQEDMCQALSVSPRLKYESKGGPSIVQIMELLINSQSSFDDRKHFFKSVILFDLLHNTDGHGKNFSLRMTKKGFDLTPLYDVLSAHFLMDQDEDYHSKLKSCMSVNGKYSYSEISIDDWKEEALSCDLPIDTFNQICAELKKSVNELDTFIEKDQVYKDVLKTIIKGLKRRAKVLIG
jgi:serine/threonine-protein kinase HipA